MSRPKTIASSDLWNKALGTGDPTSAKRSVGKQNARWAPVDLTGGGSSPGSREYDIPHDLGSVPTVVELVSYENALVPGTVIVANGVRKENWSHSHAHSMVTLISGSFDGCRAVFKVSGR